MYEAGSNFTEPEALKSMLEGEQVADVSLSVSHLLDEQELDNQLRRLEKRLKLYNNEAPTYTDLMMKVDQVMQKMPEALQNIF